MIELMILCPILMIELMILCPILMIACPILQDDNVGSIRKRIREKLGIPDKEFEKVSFLIGCPRILPDFIRTFVPSRKYFTYV